MIFLSASDLQQVLDITGVIEAIEGGFRALSSSPSQVPPRTHLQVGREDAVLLIMPAWCGDLGVAGVKIVTSFASNRTAGEETVQSLYVLISEDTGKPLALMDGRFLTAIRTAATSAVATRKMANPGVHIVAVFGTGVQARFHLSAMGAVRSIERAIVVGSTVERARHFARKMFGSAPFPVVAAETESALQQARLVCTCTTSAKPLFSSVSVSPGTHINAVGAFTPRTRELDTETIRRARVVIDSWDSAGVEAGEVLLPIAEGRISKDHILGSLTDLICGRAQARTSPQDITVFKSTGHAIADLATAQVAYERARTTGIGTLIEP